MAKSIRRLDGQGRVILPSHIRKEMGLKKDSEVNIELEGGKVIITPTETETCYVCSERITGARSITVESWKGPRHICETCATKIVKRAMES